MGHSGVVVDDLAYAAARCGVEEAEWHGHHLGHGLLADVGLHAEGHEMRTFKRGEIERHAAHGGNACPQGVCRDVAVGLHRRTGKQYTHYKPYLYVWRDACQLAHGRQDDGNRE